MFLVRVKSSKWFNSRSRERQLSRWHLISQIEALLFNFVCDVVMKVKSYVLANESHQLLNRLLGTIAVSQFPFLCILLTSSTAFLIFFKTNISIAQSFAVWRNWGQFGQVKFSFFFESSRLDCRGTIACTTGGSKGL